MDATSYTEAREKLAEMMKQVCRDHEPMIITRKGEDSVVLISLEDYESLVATVSATNYI